MTLMQTIYLASPSTALKHIDNDKVKEIWAGMAKLKHQEGEYYEQLAGMVDEMTPEVIYQSVQATPRPSTQCTHLCRRAPGRIGECRAV